MDEKKFILDSNIWISYIITDRLDELITSIVQKEFEIYGDGHLLDEISNVLFRPRFKKYFKAPVSHFIEVIEMALIMTKTQPYTSYLPITMIIF